MLSWGEFRAARPDLAEAGRDLFCQVGIGLAFLATVRPDGGPRLHPICVIVTEKALYGLIIPSPKLGDLRRDGRYSLHCYPPMDNEDAFYLTGRAVLHETPEVRRSVIEAFLNQPGRIGPPLEVAHFDGQTAVEFLVETCLLTRTTGHGDTQPQHTVWAAGATA